MPIQVAPKHGRIVRPWLPSAEGIMDEMDIERLLDLEAELRYLLNRWDPMHVYDEALDYPPDEYDSLIAPLLAKLNAGLGVAEISEFLWYDLEDHFGLDPAYLKSDAFAAKLVAWFQSHSR